MVHLTTFICKAYHGGHLTIRLDLGGCTNWPFYRIVAVHNRCLRDGRFRSTWATTIHCPTITEKNLLPSTGPDLALVSLWGSAHLSKPIGETSGSFWLSPPPISPLHLVMTTNAERVQRKRALEVLLESQKEESEPKETEAS